MQARSPVNERRPAGNPQPGSHPKGLATGPLAIAGPTIPAAADRRGKVRIARASVFAPAPGRTLWALTFLCPHCHRGHFQRARSEDDVARVRRTGCGHRVLVKPARTYRGLAA